MLSNKCLWYTGVCLLISCMVHANDAATTTTTTTKYFSRAVCGVEKFPCGSGQCINDQKLCDGIPDCYDNSDETAQTCSEFSCPKTTFRCAYGACIAKHFLCNGIKDCFDGSDETNCGYTPGYEPSTSPARDAPSARPQLAINCLVPNNPENGEYTIGGQEEMNYKTGDILSSFSVLITSCNDGYHVSPANNIYSVCANGIWTPVPSRCSRLPQGIVSESSRTCECHCPLILIK